MRGGIIVGIVEERVKCPRYKNCSTCNHGDGHGIYVKLRITVAGKQRKYYLGKKEDILANRDSYPYIWQELDGSFSLVKTMIDYDKHIRPLEMKRLANAHIREEKKKQKEWKEQQAVKKIRARQAVEAVGMTD
jgi:hypothetical protein